MADALSRALVGHPENTDLTVQLTCAMVEQRVSPADMGEL